MSYQIKCNNEVNLVGRVIKFHKNVKCNNRNALRICLAMPNDENYELDPNYAYIYLYVDSKKKPFIKRGMCIAINGHVECNYGQRIIADVFSILKEAK